MEPLDWYSVFQYLESSWGFVKFCDAEKHKSPSKLKHREASEHVDLTTSAQMFRVEPTDGSVGCKLREMLKNPVVDVEHLQIVPSVHS